MTGKPDPLDEGDTASESYARRLQAKEQIFWKRFFNVQAPYQWNLRRQQLGRTLDFGCGIGRNLGTLKPGSVGIDHNAASVAIARQRGFTALTVEQWHTSDLRSPDAFDAILLAHVVEHMTADAAEQLLRDYLPSLRPGGKVFFICPQERGFASDRTHIEFTDGPALIRLAELVGLRAGRWYSFPFPRPAGKVFTYNEFCLLAAKPE